MPCSKDSEQLSHVRGPIGYTKTLVLKAQQTEEYSHSVEQLERREIPTLRKS
jgi:hypothetical protein